MSGAEAGDPRLLALASYAASGHGMALLRVGAVLNHLHRPPRPEAALRCPTCRDGRGRPAPWPCQTFMELNRAMGGDPGPAARLAAAQGLKVAAPLDIEALMAAEREARWRGEQEAAEGG